MPVVTVEIVMEPDQQLEEGLADRLADQLGEAFDAAPGTTWVKLAPILRSRYAESSGGPAPRVFPVFVYVLKARLPENTDLEGEVSRITYTVAHTCKRPAENVHVIYEPPASGRVAFGGKLVQR